MTARRSAPRRKKQNVQRRLLSKSGRVPGRPLEGDEPEINTVEAWLARHAEQRAKAVEEPQELTV